jgi:hypothetical protein
MASRRPYNVFRIVNEARKEIFLAATTQSVVRAIAAIRDRRPAELAGWELDDISAFESLDFDLTREAAVAFMEARISRGKDRGYRYIVAWPDSDLGSRD